MIKKSVKDYFEDEENEEEEVASYSVSLKNMNKENFSGKRFNEWHIIEVVDQRKNIYKVACSCGKEFVRDVYVIVNYQINQCRFCYKKNPWFKFNRNE